VRDVPRSTAIDPFTLTLPSIGPATPRSDGRPHAGDEFGQHHITHAPVTALAKPIEGLSCSVLARFSCGMATRVAPSTLSSAGRARRTGASTEVDAPGPWLRLRTLPKHARLHRAGLLKRPIGYWVPSRYVRAIGLLQGLLTLVAELTGSCLSHSATLAKPTGRALLARLWSGLQVLLQVAHLTRIEIAHRPAN